ncbi:MAG: holo-ACP synthase [Chitinophagaceae bacterium]|nr:holo-ACP synthase [Chitinophagaceae bacterium]
MIYGIGIDLAEVNRIQEKISRNPDFARHVFSEKEIDYCEKQKKSFEHYAARWAVKEAFLKAFGLKFIGNHRFYEIETVHDEFGKPFIELSGLMKDAFDEKELGRIFVTISHTSTLAAAYVMIEFANK